MSNKVAIPPEVQACWNVVARFLNKQSELSFQINPWDEKSNGSFRPAYTIETIDQNIRIVANSRWKNEVKELN